LERPLHILILPPEEFIPPKSPVSAIFQYHQALALCDLGHKVGVLSVTPSLGLKPLLVSLFRKLTGRQIFYRQVRDATAMGIFRAIVQSLLLPDKTRSENINGIDVIRRQLFCWSDGTFQEELNYYKRTLTSAFHIYIERHGLPDVVHVHNAWLAGTASMDFIRSKGIPFCITEHSTYYVRNIIPEQYYPLLRDVYAAADVRIAVSPSLAKLLSDRQLVKDVRFIPNMLDPIFAQPMPFIEKHRDVFTFFNVAELTEKKGHAILLEAFASAFKGQPNIRLVIGGDGALMNTLGHHADVLGIDSQVEFTGMLDRASLRLRMMEADVFVLPSLFETFGVVVIEAMSCGKPVIATVCGGPEHILDASTGILIEAGNAKALAGAMIEMHARSGSYDPDLIRLKALGEYGPQVVAKSLEGVYHEILGTNQ
jgi:glycosyltransferase involved in cell wall biosynthesis